MGVDTPADRRRRGLKTLDESTASEAVAVSSVRARPAAARIPGRLGRSSGLEGEWELRNADDTLTLLVGGQKIQLGRSAAQKVWVSGAAAAGG